MRVILGIEGNPETQAFEVTRSVGPDGHFVSDSHTCEHMRRPHFILSLANQYTRETWVKMVSKDTSQRAREMACDILKKHVPQPLDAMKEPTIRKTFKEIVT